jgi:hypothetical protein
LGSSEVAQIFPTFTYSRRECLPRHCGRGAGRSDEFQCEAEGIRKVKLGAFAGAVIVMMNLGAAGAPNGVEGWVMQNGAIMIEGRRFSDPDALRDKMLELSKRNPPLKLHLLSEHEMSAETANALTALLQKAGWKGPVGVLTPPRNLAGSPITP